MEKNRDSKWLLRVPAGRWTRGRSCRLPHYPALNPLCPARCLSSNISRKDPLLFTAPLKWSTGKHLCFPRPIQKKCCPGHSKTQLTWWWQIICGFPTCAWRFSKPFVPDHRPPVQLSPAPTVEARRSGTLPWWDCLMRIYPPFKQFGRVPPRSILILGTNSKTISMPTEV